MTLDNKPSNRHKKSPEEVIVLRFLFVFLFAGLANHIFAGDCELDAGRYVTVGGSEAHIAMSFFSGGKVVLEHETWMPGQYEARSSQRIVGTWSCKGPKISIFLRGTEYSAVIEPLGPNPLRIDPDALVLHVVDKEEIDDLVDGGIFYKEDQLE